MKNRIETIRKLLEFLEVEVKKSNFNSEFNKEEAFDELASAIICLEDFQEILERDEELGRMQAEIDEPEQAV